MPATTNGVSTLCKADTNHTTKVATAKPISQGAHERFSVCGINFPIQSKPFFSTLMLHIGNKIIYCAPQHFSAGALKRKCFSTIARPPSKTRTQMFVFKNHLNCLCRMADAQKKPANTGGLNQTCRSAMTVFKHFLLIIAQNRHRLVKLQLLLRVQRFINHPHHTIAVEHRRHANINIVMTVSAVQ